MMVDDWSTFWRMTEMMTDFGFLVTVFVQFFVNQDQCPLPQPLPNPKFGSPALISGIFTVVGDVVIQKFDHFLLLFVSQIFAADLFAKFVIELDCAFVIS